jgi:hypothetical protein
MVIVEKLVEWRLAGETEVLGEILPRRHFVHHKSHMTRGTKLNNDITGLFFSKYFFGLHIVQISTNKTRLISGNACYHSDQNFTSSRLLSENMKVYSKL